MEFGAKSKYSRPGSPLPLRLFVVGECNEAASELTRLARTGSPAPESIKETKSDEDELSPKGSHYPRRRIGADDDDAKFLCLLARRRLLGMRRVRRGRYRRCGHLTPIRSPR